MAERPSILARTISTPVILGAILVLVALAAVAVGTGPFNQTVIEIFIRVVLVVGLYVFIGNSGVISFGHIGFACLGDRKSTRLNSSHIPLSRMPSSA